MARTVVLEFPQWQGSSSPFRHRLGAGTQRLAELWRTLGPAGGEPDDDELVVRVPIRPEAGAEVGGIASLAEVLMHARWAVAVLYEHGPERVVTLGGDCGVEMAPVAYLNDRHRNLTVLWLDAHADANTPERSPSHTFHGMVLRHLAGEGHPQFRLSVDLRVPPDRLVLAGARALDPDEQDFLRAHRVTHLTPERCTPAEIIAELARRGGPVYIHLDLDVLDPGQFGAVGCPTPGGLRVDDLELVLRAVHANHDVVGMSVTEYQPADPDEAGGEGSGPDDATVGRLLAALTNR